jgi:signal transduction histidine kinase
VRIATKLKLAALLTTGAILLSALILLYTNVQVQKQLVNNQLAGDISEGLDGLRFLSMDYLLKQEDRVKVQWRSKHASLGRLLALAEFEGPEERRALQRLRQTHDSLAYLFSEIVAGEKLPESTRERVALRSDLLRRVQSQLIAKVEVMSADAARLSEHSREVVVGTLVRAKTYVLLCGLALGAVAGLLLMIMRDLVRSLSQLQTGTRIVGAGNLDHRMDLSSGDEFGDLGRSFDRMISRLRESQGVLKQEIAERERIGIRLRQANAELLSASRMKSEFLASMSHELRTPLNGIIGFSEFLVDERPGKLNDKQKEYLNDVLNSGRHLLQLINDVLDLSKVEAGKMELYPEIFTLREAIDEVCSIISPLSQKKGITLKKEIAPEIGKVALDRQKFKQVLFNLLSNAVKFTDSEGCVEVVCALRGANELCLQVRDTGIGIAPQDIRRLFVEFQQLDSGTARRYEGTGLGLVLTRNIIEIQQGSIAVDSEPGKGSTFTVILPLSLEGGARERTAAA